MYYNECIYFRDDGFCRNPLVKNRDVGYFQKAGKCFIERMEKKEETKVCAECGRDLPVDQFARNASGPTKYCKECMGKKRSHGKSVKVSVDLNIGRYTDSELADELRRRGYSGKLTKTEEIEV